MSRTPSAVVIVISALALTTYAAGPTFRPDAVFRGSALTGWTPLGQADWRAQNGEIVGTPKQPGGGWLVLNKSYQDVAVYTNVTCAAGCKAGVLMRAEKTPDGGMKGVYVSLTEGDLAVLRSDARRAGCREVARTAFRPVARGGGGGGGGAGAPVRAARRWRRPRRGAGAPGAGAAAAGRLGAIAQPGATTGDGGTRRAADAAGRDLPGLMLVRPASTRPARATSSTSRSPTTRSSSAGTAGRSAPLAGTRLKRSASTARSRSTSAAPARPPSRTSRTPI